MEYLKLIQENIPENVILLIIAMVSMSLGIMFYYLLLKNKNKPVKQKQKEQKEEIKLREYKPFDTTRAKTEFDMEEEEIQEFLEELKEQIEEELPTIEKTAKEEKYAELKNAVHKIKGSAVNLAEGGIAEVLFNFNHYLSEGGKDKKEIDLYIRETKEYKNKL